MMRNLRVMVFVVVVLVLTTALIGCTEGVRDVNAGFPAGTQSILSPGNRYTWAVPTEVNGTRCVVLVANGPGNAIACDFK